ncbi:MAG: hypothetical protein ACOVRN_15215 [Flavobacterium sp.]
MKSFFSDQNKTKVIGLFTILFFIWILLYFIPELFVSLFRTLLGNLLLLLFTLMVYMYNHVYGILTGLVIVVLYRFAQLSKEGFEISINGTFSLDPQEDKPSWADLDQEFLRIQNTINEHTVFDMETIHQQASKHELAYFNKHGKWPWSQEVIDLFQESVRHNPYVRTLPDQATEYARTIYNEAAILRILTYQTKEGQFLLNGVLVSDASGNKLEELPSGFGDFPYATGQLSNRVDDVIRCNLKNEHNPTLERVRYAGKGGIFGDQKEEITPVDYRHLETIIPGFTFINNPCNPCGSMAAVPDYSCAYRLRVKDKPPIVSSVWQYLWGIRDNPLKALNSLF